MKQIITVFLILMIFIKAEAQVINANPSTYISALETLAPGDTLLLAPGNYMDRLPIDHLNGTLSQPIVIMGSGDSTCFLGEACCNTVSIIKSSFITLKDFKVDGQNIAIDGVKAEGTAGNWAHNIVLENLLIIAHGANQQTVGISTKCPAWDWVIRGCTIDAAGTGIYLGNSDGEDPFVNGLIEYNLIKNSLGYNLQVKHQNEESRNIDGMTLNGNTLIRHNVFSKQSNAIDGVSARPNLLVGNFPAIGDGSNDYYEIYGNLFWQNPSESLFQGTGNIAFYDNICVNNSGGNGIAIQSHNFFDPRNIKIFHNTIITDLSWGIRLMNTDMNYQKYIYGNAVFSDHETPIRIVGGGIATANVSDNITDVISNANNYVNNATNDIATIDLYPIIGSALHASLIPTSLFDLFTDFSKDFNEENRSWKYRGAYSGEGINNGWHLSIEKKQEPDVITAYTWDSSNDTPRIYLFPNPASERTYISFDNPMSDVEVSIVTTAGQVIYYKHFDRFLKVELSTSELEHGMYFVVINVADASHVLKLIR